MDAPNGTAWNIINSPPAWIAAIGAFIKWVVSPALTSYTRKELEPELAVLATVQPLTARVTRLETALEALPALAESVARIEGQLQEALKRHD